MRIGNVDGGELYDEGELWGFAQQLYNQTESQSLDDDSLSSGGTGSGDFCTLLDPIRSCEVMALSPR